MKPMEPVTIETEWGDPVILTNMRDASLCMQVGDDSEYRVTYLTRDEARKLIDSLMEWLT